MRTLFAPRDDGTNLAQHLSALGKTVAQEELPAELQMVWQLYWEWKERVGTMTWDTIMNAAHVLPTPSLAVVTLFLIIDTVWQGDNHE